MTLVETTNSKFAQFGSTSGSGRQPEPEAATASKLARTDAGHGTAGERGMPVAAMPQGSQSGSASAGARRPTRGRQW